MSCTNCFNGCVEIVSDQCVRYTGPTISALNITTGDTLTHVEEMITDKLVPLLVGTGDVITIASGDKCALINGFLTGITSPNSTQLFTALVKSVCSLQTQVTAVAADIAVLNADYTIGCLTGVTASSDTHAILQAVITRLCTVVTDLAALGLNVSTNYVKLADLNSLIAAYLASVGTNTKYYNRMVPYSVVEYYGSLTGKFDSTGAGITGTDWEKIYLCNGLNGTPDKRGRVPVGAIVGVGGGALDAAVNPANVGNPNYALGDGGGANTVTLNSTQIPAHSHPIVITDPGHVHAPGSSIFRGNRTTDDSGGTQCVATQLSNSDPALTGPQYTASATTGITASISNTGGGLGHANIQPVRACYYIMYIP
jgi:microcystin-dependent protein